MCLFFGFCREGDTTILHISIYIYIYFYLLVDVYILIYYTNMIYNVIIHLL